MRLRFKDKLQITKRQGYYNESGIWVESDNGLPEEIPCNIQPLRKRKDAENLPEGKRGRQAWIVYFPFDVPVDCADDLTGEAGDETIIDGFNCEAVYSEKWRHLRLKHYKVLFVRNDVKGNTA